MECGRISRDGKQRVEAQATLRELQTLLRKAGWRDLLGGWSDHDLSSRNIDIWNSYVHYDAFFWVYSYGSQAGRAKQRDAAATELSGGRWAYESARARYRYLR